MVRYTMNQQKITYTLGISEIEEAFRNYVNNHKSADGKDGICGEDAIIEWEMEPPPSAMPARVHIVSYYLNEK